MTRLITGLALAAALVAGGLSTNHARAEKAAPAPQPGVLITTDQANLFSPGGIERAKSTLAGTRFDHGLTVTVDTYPEVPADKKVAAEEAKGDRAKWRQFMETWVKERAQIEKNGGIYIIIVEKPTGGIAVIADRQTRERGFSDQDEATVREKLTPYLSKAKNESDPAKARQIRDTGLKEAVDFIVADLKDTTVQAAAASASTVKNSQEKQSSGMSIGGWICIGLCVLLGVWLIIGLIRAFTGGGGAGGPGGGGGGFGSALLGGLFGTMAGMWLYNSMFGHGGMFGGSDAYAGDGGASGGGDTGAGDYGGETASGGDYGGGGDFGGGGDYGGGGDFGGDFGGGGDF